MLDQLLLEAGSQLLGTGLVGAFCIFLLYVIGKREQELRNVRQEYKEAIEALHEQIQELQDSRLQEVKLIVEQIGSNKTAIEATNVVALRLAALVDNLLQVVAKIEGQRNETRRPSRGS